jgi:hypothetical protein
MAAKRKTQTLKKQRTGGVRRRPDVAQTIVGKSTLSARSAPAETPMDKPIAFSAEQIQWLTDRIYAQVYGEPIGTEMVAEILETVGAEHVPPDLNVEHLKADIYIAWRFYNDFKRLTFKGDRSRLKTYAENVRIAVHDLEKILNEESWEADIFRYNRLSREMFPLNSFRIQLQSFPKMVAAFEGFYSKKATPGAQDAFGLTATEWLFGWWLPEMFKKFFKQETNRNRQRGEVDGAYIRFAIAFAKAHRWEKLSPETVSTYMTDAQKHFGKARKENTPKISEWSLDSQGNLTRKLENF